MVPILVVILALLLFFSPACAQQRQALTGAWSPPVGQPAAAAPGGFVPVPTPAPPAKRWTLDQEEYSCQTGSQCLVITSAVERRGISIQPAQGVAVAFPGFNLSLRQRATDNRWVFEKSDLPTGLQRLVLVLESGKIQPLDTSPDPGVPTRINLDRWPS